MKASEIRFAVSPVKGGKQLVGAFDGVFENDDQIAEYMREQGKVLIEYGDRLDRLTAERRKQVTGEAANGSR